jgi:pyridoxal phosphate enzyme (YggS family)
MDISLLTQIKARYLHVQEQIDQAAQQSGRNPDAVRLMVVTKAQPMPVVRAAVEAGACILGENYAEEALEKILALRPDFAVEWHMIGHVQSRKASLVARNFDMLHSLDSLKLASRLDRFLDEQGKSMLVLLEANVSGEESKYGWPAWDEDRWPDLLPEFEKILALPRLEVCGLMTMPPYFEDPERTRPFFRRLCNLRDFLQKNLPQMDWRELSMGTSVDFVAAIQEGATYVRIGQAILGERSN